MLLVFEGIDGTGKHTQISMLCAFLRQNRVRFKLHKYPTKKAKEAFAHLSGKKDVPPGRLAKVFAEDIGGEREKIMRELSAGLVVICDRYLHSTLAYQGVGAGYAKLKPLLRRSKAPVPDLVILLDMPAEKSAERKMRQKKPDRFEKDIAFLGKVRKNYLRMASELFLSYKYDVIDASMGKEKVFSYVAMSVEPLLARKAGKRFFTRRPGARSAGRP